MEETSQEAQSVTTEGSTVTESGEQGTPTEGTGEWYLYDGVQGVGEKPEYFNSDKYKTLGEQAKAQRELEKKFGAFTGAPEEYSMGEGVEYNAEHPLFAELQQYGKDNNLSNEGYQTLVNVLVENEKARVEEEKQMREEVIAGLGENGHARIQNIDDYLNANAQLNEEQVAMIEQAKGMPGGVELLETFIELGKTSKPANEAMVETKTMYSREELNQMQFAKDEFGNRKMSSDPAYRKKVEDYHAKLLAQG